MENQYYEKKYGEAIYFLKNEMYKSADKIVDELITIKRETDIVFLKALCSYNLGEYNEAVLNCKECLEDNYDQGECNYLLALIYMEKEAYDLSEVYFKKSLEFNKSSGEIYAQFGYLYINKNEKQKAKEMLDKAINIEAYNEIVLKNYLLYHIVFNKKRIYTKLLYKSINNKNIKISTLAKSALIDVYNGNYNKSLDTFRMAFSIDPDNPELLGALLEIESLDKWYMLPNRFVLKYGALKIFILYVMLIMMFYIFDLKNFYIGITSIILLVNLYNLFICNYIKYRELNGE